MAYYEFVGKDASSKSEKFWEITQVENTVTVRFGKIGVNGQTKDKEHPTKEEADKEVAMLIKEKQKRVTSKNQNLSIQACQYPYLSFVDNQLSKDGVWRWQK